MRDGVEEEAAGGREDLEADGGTRSGARGFGAPAVEGAPSRRGLLLLLLLYGDDGHAPVGEGKV